MANQTVKSDALPAGNKRQTALSLKRDRIKRNIYMEASPSNRAEAGLATEATSRRITKKDMKNCRVLVRRDALSAITNSSSQTSLLTQRAIPRDSDSVSSEDSCDLLTTGLVGYSSSDTTSTDREKDAEIIYVKTWTPGNDGQTSEARILSEMEPLSKARSFSVRESDSETEVPTLSESSSKNKSVLGSETCSESGFFTISKSLSISSPPFCHKKPVDRKGVSRSTVEVVDLTGDDVEQDATTSSSSSASHHFSEAGLTNTTLSEKKRKKIKRRGDVFRGVECVKEMTELQLRRWLYVKKPLMIELFKGQEHSWRHDNFAAGCKKRSDLVHQMDTHHFHKDHVDIITETLLHVFCGKNMKYFGYVMSVLVPECLVRIIADIHKVSFKEAEEMMMDYGSRTV